MNEVKIQIPDNCELIKDGDTYIVKEKKQIPPKSWEEFCERYSIRKGEAYIDTTGTIISADIDLKGRGYRNWCTSKEEAEAFLALIQLRQLRKAWVGDCVDFNDAFYSIYADRGVLLEVSKFAVARVLSFPTKEMAKDFLDCFRDLCEIAKPLL